MDIILSLNQGVVNTKKGQIQLPVDAVATSEIILFFDDLFDSFNGKKDKVLSSIISITSEHLIFWQEACNKLRRMEFVEKINHISLRRNAPKCLHNWIWTINGAKLLWNMLYNVGFSHLNLKYINQDPIENCFGQIRDNGHRNINPSPYQFGACFKTLITTNLTFRHSLSSNCEGNEENSSLALLNMFSVDEITTSEEEKHIECTEAAISETTDTHLFIDAQKILQNIMRYELLRKCTECEQMINS
ncbi:uncharacterized protein LOC112589469 [Harpegnathos saltator]|uniref:uncharacterized protein LOC112589469 n=1 Tax=Harpegnathos saltator TaxID=610380 RepID=UPI000DBEE6FF|nr:uncharacterized protein LOC112589469 [Harpegnathos saltator]